MVDLRTRTPGSESERKSIQIIGEHLGGSRRKGATYAGTSSGAHTGHVGRSADELWTNKTGGRLLIELEDEESFLKLNLQEQFFLTAILGTEDDRPEGEIKATQLKQKTNRGGREPGI